MKRKQSAPVIQKSASRDKSNWIQIGVLFDPDLWRKFKATATMQGRTAGDVLEELMKEYIEQNKDS